MEIKSYEIVRGVMKLDPDNIPKEAYSTLMVNIQRGMSITEIKLQDNKIVIVLEKSTELL
jgi:hypothetical protein